AETPATITGLVTQKRTGDPVAYGVVTLAGTADTVRTSESGAFRFTTIPGKYLVSASDTTLAAFVEPRSESAPVETIRAKEVSVRIEVAPIEGVINEICHDIKIRPKTSMIVGHLTWTGAWVPSTASIHAEWQGDYG